MPGHQKIKIAIADSNEMSRKLTGTSLYLHHPEIEVVGVSDSGPGIIDFCSKNKVDIVLLEVLLTGLSGIEAAKKICQKFPGMKIIAYSIHSDWAFAVGMKDAGAYCYITNTGSLREIVEAIQSTYHNKPVHNDFTNYALSKMDKFTKYAKEKGWLGPNEAIFLRLFCLSGDLDTVSKLMGKKRRTIEGYIRTIHLLMESTSQVEMMRYAFKHGIITYDEFMRGLAI